MPAVSVLLPVLNALPYLDASLRSLARQTMGDFEIVAVNDGSEDRSGEALERAAEDEPRLRVFHQPPRGLPAALNLALAHARSPLLARHDADDLAHRRRFELQLDTMRRQPELAVVGTRLRLFPSLAVGPGMRSWAAWHNALLTHDDMANEVLIDSPLAHGTSMLSREWLERVGGWAERGWAEDVDLWLRLLEAGARFGKRAEVLYGWRQHRRSATHRDPRYARSQFIALKLDALERGLLCEAAEVTLVGVGDSLARCVPVFGKRRVVHAVTAGRPSTALLSRLRPPIVLIFGSLTARTRWRRALRERGWDEHREFVFIA